VTGRRSDITVAVATAGRPEALRRCLDALVRGTVQPAEILVVDQSADDRTRSLLGDLGAQAAHVSHITQELLGLSASRNGAFAAARTNVVAVTDDDCVPADDWIELIGDVLAKPEHPDAVSGRVLPLGPEAAGYPVSSRQETEAATYVGRQPPWRVGTGANMAVRREWWERVGGYDLRLGAGTRGAAGEDLDFVHRLLREGARIRYEPRVTVYHQRQTRERRRETRSAYGRGVGASCALWLRERDVSGITVLGQWLSMRGGRLVRAARARDRQGVEEELLVLRGTVAGLAYGATARRGRAM
jgi:GT2 family glycosyltransferase